MDLSVDADNILCVIRVVFIDGTSTILSPDQVKFVVKWYKDIQESQQPEVVVSACNIKEDVTLKRIVSFCQYYSVDPMFQFQRPLQSNDLHALVQKFYADLMMTITNNELHHLLITAHDLGIAALVELSSAKIASMIRGKTQEEIVHNLFQP